MVLKPRRTVVKVLPRNETPIVRTARYYAHNLPIAGALLRDEDNGTEQLSLLDS